MLSKFSVKKPVTIVIAVLIIIILGVTSFTNLSTDLLPSMNFPYAVVFTSYYGASPEQVETFVTKNIEDSMATVTDIKNLSSTSSENVSMVILEFNESANMDSVVLEMRESLDLIKGYFPDSVGNPMIIKINPDMMPIAQISISVDDATSTEASNFVEDVALQYFEKVTGVATVDAMGLANNEIHISIDQSELDNINKEINQMMAMAMQSAEISEEAVITSEMISGIITAQNFAMPSSYITDSDTDYLVRIGEDFSSMDELKDVTIFAMGDYVVKVSDFATVEMVNISENIYSKINNKNAIMVTLQKENSYATTDVMANVYDAIEELEADYPKAEASIIMDQAEYINMSLNSISYNLLIGALLALLILWLFLKDLKPTIIVGLSIPISLMGAIALMYFSDVTLNILSLGGLALAIGMLVDNSIVVIENIYRLKNEGKSAKKAAVEGAKQVSGAIVASTLTTISVFIPILFVQGLTSEIFRDMALTITFALTASLIIALTLVPMMSAKIMKNKIDTKKHGGIEGVKKFYAKVLKVALRRKILSIFLALLLLGASVFLALDMGIEYFPETDEGSISVTVEMDKGTEFEDLSLVLDNLTTDILTIEEIDNVSTTIGGNVMMGGTAGSNNGSMTINLIDDRDKSTIEIGDEIREMSLKYDATISVESQSTMSASTAMMGSGIEIVLRGNDFDTLELLSTELAMELESVEGLIEIDDGTTKAAPEIQVTVDREKSIANGLTTVQVYMAINDAIDEDTQISTLTTVQREYEIHLINEQEKIEYDIESLSNLEIETNMGTMVKVSDIAMVEIGSGYGTISRENQQRVLSVTASNLDGYELNDLNEDIQAIIDDMDIPEGYTIEIGGEIELVTGMVDDLRVIMIVAVLLIYLIMAAQFQSFKYPFIVLFSIPLAFTGAFLALYVTGMKISMVSLIGMVILLGVVVNNGIVLVDYINKLKENGKTTYDSIIEAGKTRLRPIIMTALTTILALSTMAIGIGDGAELMQPMAITAIGGLLYATITTLIIVPVMYATMDRRNMKKELKGKKNGKKNK